MINHFSVKLGSSVQSDEQKLTGYQIYACLLSMLKEETAEFLHENSRSPISQNILARSGKGEFLWEINVFYDTLADEIAGVLAGTKEFYAKKADIRLMIDSVQHTTVKNFADIRSRGAAMADRRNIKFDFQTTTALKKSSEFLLFPDMELMLKNWWNSWNIIFPDTPFDDEDALNLLLRGVYITSYHLSSSVYRMKGNNIKGFFGSITIGNRLSEPMKELLNALLVLSEYSGTGVKTALGMGKTTISF